MMAVDETKPTIEERYIHAAHSSHLEVKEDGGAIDQMIAAGWINRRALGTQLFRVKAEFDAVRADMTRAVATLAEGESRANRVAKAGGDAGAVRDEARRAALTERALILVQLKTLDEAKQAVGTYARQVAEREAVGLPELRVNQIAGRVLAMFLDSVCPECDGRGFNGGYNAPMLLCPACDAGKRRLGLNRPSERQFAVKLLADLERKLAFVSAQMARFLRRA